MLFDFEDYLASNLIGKDTQCATCSDWEYMHTSAIATRHAFFRAIIEWYDVSTMCLTPSSSCYTEITNLWREFRNKTMNEFTEVMTLFFNSQSCNPTIPFNDDICENYRQSLTKLRCQLKQLLRLVDGDFGGAQTTTNT
jgi:hypothetical protein